jgi:hypothetical protein
MPSGLFVGVNNHFQSIVFGAVFLRHETTESFEWAFSTFVGMMQGKAPVIMLTCLYELCPLLCYKRFA